ncbi:MAG: creatininase family protein [Promethearchaeota archaeon]
MIPEANKYRYEYMLLHDIRDVVNGPCPVAIQPSGLLEWHGEHNAVGLDALKAYYICERAAMLLGGGALLPINWVGTYGFTRYPGTVCYDDDMTYNVFFRLYTELVKVGFKVIFILTGHYGQHQMTALRTARDDAEAWAREKGLNVRFIGCNPPNLVPNVFGGDHAKQYETSMLMRTGEAWGIKLVDLTRFKTGVEIVERYDVDDAILREPEKWDWNTNLLNEEVCSASFGEYLIDAISKGMVWEILENLEELGMEYKPRGDISLPGIA